MTIAEFRDTLKLSAPPSVAPALVALWHDARGDWEAAHKVAQDVEGETGAWVHAYLHRKEGDLSNANYWYRHARRPVSSESLELEWEQIVTVLLSSEA